MNLLQSILASPVEYTNDAVLGLIAQQLMPREQPEGVEISLNKTGAPFTVFGGAHIEETALHQMYTAAKLPISVAGALMPDAHAGYGLPIGGVLATKNAVIPYGVGLDIGCRMCLSVFDIDPKQLVQQEDTYSRILKETTLFGGGRQFDKGQSHEVLDHELFQEIPLLKRLQGRAAYQLGSSGSGNHFVEFGRVTVEKEKDIPGLAPGDYLGLLSHSGSRALGAAIANHYTTIARRKRRLPGEANHLAWLDLQEEEGMEYWLAMNLAGEYASACHEVIHQKVAKQLGRQHLVRVENHHNFAWKETIEGQELIVHRKGATPAGKDIMGIIPGSMTAPGYIVRGKGETASILSAAHGAGRKMSRSAAQRSITPEKMQEMLERHGVKLIGGGVDEAPQAYKDIREVMSSQKHLVDVVGSFTPKIVRMDR